MSIALAVGCCAATSVRVWQRIQRALTVCLLVVLAACGAQSSSQQATGVPAVVASDAPLRLVLWHSWPLDLQPVLLELVNQYNRAHPDVRIIVQSMPRASLSTDMLVAAQTGSGPHLLLAPSHALGALAPQLLPLDNLVSSADLDALLPVTVASGKAKSAAGATQQYGVPITFDTPVLYYNKANVLDPPADTERLLSASHGLTDASTQPPIWGLALNLSIDTTIGYLYAFGGRVFDDQGNVVLGQAGREGTERWLQWLLTLHQDEALLAVADGIRVDGALKAQQALMTVNWANQYNAYRAVWGDKLGVAPLPQLSATGKPPAAYVQSDVLAINGLVRDRNEQQAAMAFGNYLLSEEVQRELLRAGLQPTRASLALDGAEYEAARAFRKQAEQGIAMPNSAAEVTIVWPALNQMLRAVLQQQLSPADAVSQADALLRQQLQQPVTP